MCSVTKNTKRFIDVKEVFYVFYSCHVFLCFNFFFILLNVFYLKTCLENFIKSFVKHFWDYRNELIGHSNVIYLVSPNILNKTFLFDVLKRFLFFSRF